MSNGHEITENRSLKVFVSQEIEGGGKTFGHIDYVDEKFIGVTIVQNGHCRKSSFSYCWKNHRRGMEFEQNIRLNGTNRKEEIV